MSAPVVTFEVPGHPQPKQRARTVRTRRGKSVSFTPPKTVNYEATVKLCASSARPSKWPMRARYTLCVDVLRGPAIGDLDNVVKAVSDACNGILWADDSRVYKVAAEMFDGCQRHAVRVSVVAMAVRCKNKTCGNAETFYPDAIGRCEACARRAL